MKICEVSTLPNKKIMEPYFSVVKTRNGKISVPFLDLECGEHDIEFRTKTKSLKCKIKHWLSMYGYAWEIIEIYSINKL